MALKPVGTVLMKHICCLPSTPNCRGSSLCHVQTRKAVGHGWRERRDTARMGMRHVVGEKKSLICS